LQNDPRQHVRFALEAFQRRDRDGAAEAIATLVQDKAPIGSTWGPIARMANGLHEVSLAVAAQKNYIAEAPTQVVRQQELGAIYMQFGLIDQAMALGEELIAAAPDDPGAHQFLGTAYATAGRSEQAMETLRRALSLKPDAAESWLSFVAHKRFSAHDPDLAVLQSVVAQTPPDPPRQRGTVLYALGKALDDIGDTDAAFAAYEQGAAMISAESKYDPAADTEFVDDVVTNCDRAFFARLSPSEAVENRAIFVLGMPRSGTTLTEQILVSHSAVTEGAETGVFPKAAFALANFRSATITEADSDPRWNGELWTRVGRAYQHLMADRFGPTGLLVDKTLQYTRFLGAVAHALPSAKFIWLRREPGAIAWSCFRTRFVEGLEWSWSLRDIGQHFRNEDRLFEHWTNVLGDRILALQYEDLVADPEAWMPRILAFAGLSDEPQTRTFYEAKRSVRTASVAQVRRPLYTTSVSGWRRYETKMAPFFEAYAGG
jgi:tetratricopeptide (TPR) repeat protein